MADEPQDRDAQIAALLRKPEFPRSQRYEPAFLLDNQMGPNALWLLEWLCQALPLEAGMRVLDLGCGRAMTSVFLARERGVRVWAADGTSEPVVLRGHDGALTGVAWTPDGRSVVSSSQYDATVRLWPADGRGAPRVLSVDAPVFRARPSPDARLLAVPEEDGALRLFRLSDLVELPPFPARPDALAAAAFSADGARLALASKDGSVRVLASDGTGEQLVLRGHASGVVHAAFSPDGAELATASWDGTVRIWTADWARLVARLRAATTACLPVSHRIQVLGESAREAQARNGDCQRAHGRPPVPPQPPAAARAPGPPGERKG